MSSSSSISDTVMHIFVEIRKRWTDMLKFKVIAMVRNGELKGDLLLSHLILVCLEYWNDALL